MIQEQETRIKLTGDSSSLNRELKKARDESKRLKDSEKELSEKRKQSIERESEALQELKGTLGSVSGAFKDTGSVGLEAIGGITDSLGLLANLAQAAGLNIRQLQARFTSLARYGITPVSVGLGLLAGQQIAAGIVSLTKELDTLYDTLQRDMKMSFRDEVKSTEQLKSEISELTQSLKALEEEAKATEGIGGAFRSMFKAIGELGTDAISVGPFAMFETMQKVIMKSAENMAAETEMADQRKEAIARKQEVIERRILQVDQDRLEVAKLLGKGRDMEAAQLKKQQANMRELLGLEGERFRVVKARQEAEDEANNPLSGTSEMDRNRLRREERKEDRRLEREKQRRKQNEGLDRVERDVNGNVISGIDPESGKRIRIPRSENRKVGEGQEFKGLDRLKEIQGPQIPVKEPEKPTLPTPQEKAAEDAIKATKPVVDEIKLLRQDIKEGTLK